MKEPEKKSEFDKWWATEEPRYHDIASTARSAALLGWEAADARVRTELKALQADALALSTLANGYAGNLDLLKQMQELSRKVLASLRKENYGI